MQKEIRDVNYIKKSEGSGLLRKLIVGAIASGAIVAGSLLSYNALKKESNYISEYTDNFAYFRSDSSINQYIPTSITHNIEFTDRKKGILFISDGSLDKTADGKADYVLEGLEDEFGKLSEFPRHRDRDYESNPRLFDKADILLKEVKEKE